MKRILLMEDDRELATYWQAGLEKHGYYVAHATDVDVAIAALKGEHFDLVISDILIRDVNDRIGPKGGFSLFTHISLNMKEHERPKIIAISGASPSLNLLKHASMLKAARTLEKPVAIEELLSVVDEVVGVGDG